MRVFALKGTPAATPEVASLARECGLKLIVVAPGVQAGAIEDAGEPVYARRIEIIGEAL